MAGRKRCEKCGIPTRRKVCLCAGAPAPVKKAVKKMKKPRSGI
jgi:hypothetical protein